MNDPDTNLTPNLDMANEKDRGLLRRAIAGGTSHRKRWPIPDEVKALAAEKLGNALKRCDEIDDAKDYVNSVSSCGRTICAMEGQNQADDHLIVKTEVGEKLNVNHAAAPAANIDPELASMLSDYAARKGLLGIEALPGPVQTAGNTVGGHQNGNGNGNGHTNGNGKH